MKQPISAQDMKLATMMQMLSMFRSTACPFDPRGNLHQFVQHYGLIIDGRPFDLATFSHLRELYEAVCNYIVVMAGAQSGKSVWIMAELLRAGILRWGANIGYYFPDNHLPVTFSRSRFAPMVRSSPELGAWLGRGTADRDDVDTAHVKAFGATTFMFLSVAGKSTTEGTPMQGVFFDEVRRMDRGDIQRAEERTSAQKDPLFRYVSTAMFPDSDIHKYFLRGDQRFFHSDCACVDGIVLSLSWPECVLDLRSATPQLRAKAEHAFSHAGVPFGGMTELERERWGDVVYWCPKCGTILTDPRVGWWEPHAPQNHGQRSYQLPQFLNPMWPAARMWDAFNQPGLDVQEFHNSKRGMPYLSTESVPVSADALAASVDPRLKWIALQPPDWLDENGGYTAMGVDVQRGYLVAVLKQRLPSGHYATVHVEVVHRNQGAGNPWERLAEMMLRFRVRYCVIDSQPEWDSARRFATAFPGRVWLCQYVESGPGSSMVAWGDAQKRKREKGDAKMKYIVNVARTTAFQWSLGMWKQGLKCWPKPDELLQTLPVQKGAPVLAANLSGGAWQPVRVAVDLYALHLQRVAILRSNLSTDPNGRTGRFTLRAERIGLDPHFAHAELYADVALSRLGAPMGSQNPAQIAAE